MPNKLLTIIALVDILIVLLASIGVQISLDESIDNRQIYIPPVRGGRHRLVDSPTRELETVGSRS